MKEAEEMRSLILILEIYEKDIAKFAAENLSRINKLRLMVEALRGEK